MVPQNACPDCGIQLPTEAKFCFSCGHKLTSVRTCPHCSAKLIPGSKFCGECGKPINDDAGNQNSEQ
jgi:predicted amidophosphoribosyltransferase